MPVTLTDEQVAQLKQQLDAGARSKQIADMVDSIYNDPELGVEARKLIKKKYPDLAIPDYDIQQRVDAALAEERKEREEEKRKAREAEEDNNWKSRRKATQDEYGFSDETMKRVEALMVEKKIPDYDVAATYFASKEPQPSGDEGYQSQFWNHHNTDSFKEISKDPEEWARKEILQAARADQQRARQMR